MSQSPMTALCVARDTKIGSMRPALISTRLTKFAKCSLILLVVSAWLAITCSEWEKSPEQI